MQDKPLISFDYAIKYLLKSKGDYDIIEGFISALFASQGYPAIKINALLDSESNKESKILKRSIADLIVEDADDNKYIVEIERSHTSNFMHKACFNSSRLIIDNIGSSQDYTTIKKVFHISLLCYNQDILAAAEEKGVKKGMKKGRQDRDIEIVKSMLMEGDSIDKIARVSGLSMSVIEEIKKST